MFGIREIGARAVFAPPATDGGSSAPETVTETTSATVDELKGRIAALDIAVARLAGEVQTNAVIERTQSILIIQGKLAVAVARLSISAAETQAAINDLKSAAQRMEAEAKKMETAARALTQATQVLQKSVKVLSFFE